jgi:hypothetical protein
MTHDSDFILAPLFFKSAGRIQVQPHGLIIAPKGMGWDGTHKIIAAESRV